MKSNVRYIKKRCFKDFDKAGLKAAIKDTQWYDVYCLTDVNVAVTLLTEKLTTVLDMFAPIRTVQVLSKYAPWLSKATKTTMKERDDVQVAAVSSQDPLMWGEYRRLRNKATSQQKADVKAWETGQLDHLSNNNTDLWRNLKGWLGWKNSGPPTKLFHGGRLVTSPQGLADTMNDFFTEKVRNLRRNLPQGVNDSLEHLKKLMTTRTCNFTLKPVHPDTVLKIVTDLKNSKSTGLDNIDVWTLKLIIEDVLPALTHIINLSLTTLIFPNVWKLAKVIPLLNSLCPGNYRPVALLSSKVLEKVVEYMESNNLRPKPSWL